MRLRRHTSMRKGVLVVYTNEQRDTAVEMYRTGNSLRKCAKAIGCSHTIVRKWIRETNVPLRRYGAGVYPDDIRDEVLRLHREGISLRDLRKAFGCMPGTVIAWEKKKAAE